MWSFPEGPTRDRFEYLWQDFRSRPERVRLATRLGGVLGGILMLGVILLLTRGHPKPQKVAQSSQPSGPVAPAPAAVVKDAFGFAQELESRLRGDGRFAKVYLVPTAADAAQRYGKVVVMGEVASPADLRALQGEAVRGGVPVAMEWQVVVGGAPAR